MQMSLKLKNLLLTIAMVLPFGLIAQNQTLTYDTTIGSPPATLKDVAWMEGHWRGEALGGIVEEIWSPPLGNSMMCVFKMVQDDEVQFYEICTITEREGTLILQLKHFHGNLHAWEEKDETVDFPLVKVTPGKVYFDGFTVERISEDEINIYVVIGHSDGKSEEVRFVYKRV